MSTVKTSLEIGSSPHITSGASVDVIMRNVVYALLPVCVFAVYAFGLAAALVLRYFYVQFHYKQRIASEASARLEALQARIRPHFFFNCMNTIAALTRSDPDLAERADVFDRAPGDRAVGDDDLAVVEDELREHDDRTTTERALKTPRRSEQTPNE